MKSNNGVFHPPSPQPPSPFFILSLTLLSFSTSSLSTPLLLSIFLFIIMLLFHLILLHLSLLRSHLKFASPSSLFFNFPGYPFLLSNPCFRTRSRVVLSKLSKIKILLVQLCVNAITVGVMKSNTYLTPQMVFSIPSIWCHLCRSITSIFDPTFKSYNRHKQCEAIPICLEERSSNSLVQALNRTLAGRLLTAKRPSVANLMLAASRLWNCTHRLRCYDHGKCLYSFEFTFAPDVEKVVSGGPWYINGDLLLISRMNPNQSIEQLPFSFTKLWVRCYDLPPKCFTKDYAEAIGNSLGRFCETDLPSDDPDEAKLLIQTIPTVRKYLRVKFDFNLYGPLKSTQSIKICNSKKVVVEEHISRLTYERLPHTCFRCGFLGHLVEECSFVGPLLYGEWIRAEKFFRINLQNVAIPKSISTNKEGQRSTSLRVENKVTQVSNVAELVNSLVNDPAIIKANFSQARAEGLPTSKGKSPMLSPPHNSSLVPYTNASPSKSLSPITVFGPPPESIMGPVPTFMHSHGSPLGTDTILIDSDEGQFVSFLNSISSQDDGFAPNASRCLFNNDQSHQPSPTNVKGLTPSPITSEAVVFQTETSSGMLSNVFKEEIRKLPVGRKRAQGNPQTPRPKRGRQSAVSDGQA